MDCIQFLGVSAWWLRCWPKVLDNDTLLSEELAAGGNFTQVSPSRSLVVGLCAAFGTCLYDADLYSERSMPPSRCLWIYTPLLPGPVSLASGSKPWLRKRKKKKASCSISAIIPHELAHLAPLNSAVAGGLYAGWIDG